MWRSMRWAGLSVCICAGLLAGGTGVTAVASLASTILNNPEDTAKVRIWDMFRMDNNTVAIVLAMCHDLKRFWPDHLHHSRRSSK